jgi:membrane protein
VGKRVRLDARRVRELLRSAVTGVETAFRVIEGESVRLRAMALTYISLFALVPALVVAFSVVQAFTGMDRISDRVHEFLFENLAVGARATIEPYLDRFIKNAHATSAGLVGGLLLAWSAITLFSNVEAAVNDIWGIKRRRSLAQQAVIYWVGLTLGPLLLAGSATLGHTTRTFLTGAGARSLAVTAGVLLTCLFFAVLYHLVPNTKVRVRASVVGGLVAGVAWEIAKWSYTFAVAKVFRYHAVYGSVAAIPTFLFWLFVSWTILLFGARVAYVVQYASTVISGVPHAASASGKEILAGQAMLIVARAYDEEAPAPDAGDIATRLGATAEQAGEAIAGLRQQALVVALADGGLVPARPLEKISLLDVRRAVAGRAAAVVTPGLLPGIIKGIEDQAADQLERVSFRVLCDRDRGGAKGSGAGAVEAAPGSDAASALSRA